MTKKLLALCMAASMLVACDSKSGKNGDEQKQTFEQVESMRQELAESGKEYLSFFSIEVISLQEVVADTNENVATEKAVEAEAENMEEASATEAESEVAETEEGPIMIEIADFENNAENFIDQEVMIEGTVDHICEHGGKKLFVKDGENRIKVTASDAISQFDQALVGSKVIVTGYVRELKIDEAYLAEWEAELMEAAKEEKQEKEKCERDDEALESAE